MPEAEVATGIWRVVADSFVQTASVLGVIGVLAPLLVGVLLAYRGAGVDEVLNDIHRLNLPKTAKPLQAEVSQQDRN